MKMIRAVIRPEAVDKVADSLEVGGFTALTRIEVFGRGKQKGITGFVGFVQFAKDIDMSVNSPTWKFITPPWRQNSNA